MSMHRERVLALSVRSDQLITRSVELICQSDQLRERAQQLIKTARDLQHYSEWPVKKTA